MQKVDDDCRIAPKDRFNIVYIICFFLGIGTLLPYNFFINANEYFKYKFRLISPNSSDSNSSSLTHLQVAFVNYVNIASNVSTLLTVIWHTLYGYSIAINKRIFISGFSVFTLFLITTIFVRIDTDSWQIGFFALTIVSVVLINVFAAVYGCSIYGYVSTFPQNYTQSVCIGQVCAGMFAAICEIITLAFINDPNETGLMYFLIASAFMLLNLISYFFMTKMKFASYYRKNDSIININSTENDESTPLVNNTPEAKQNSDLKVIKLTFKQCAFFLITTFFIYITSFSIYPGVSASVKSTSTSKNKLSTIYFTPLMFLIQNIGDFTARVIGGRFPLSINNKKWIALMSYSRFILIPLIILCNIQPRHTQNLVFFGDITFFILIFVLGFTNGYITTVCLMYIPKLVHSSLSELASSMGQLFLMLGIVSGSLIAFLITSLI